MSLLIACLLTVGIELAFFLCFGYRDRNAISIIILVNVITNLLLNLTLALIGKTWISALLLESLVVVTEYVVYAMAFGRGRKLFFLTLGANVLSCGIGLLLFSPFC